jgi:hypothetical protein
MKWVSISQKATFFIVTAVRASNFTLLKVYHHRGTARYNNGACSGSDVKVNVRPDRIQRGLNLYDTHCTSEVTTRSQRDRSLVFSHPEGCKTWTERTEHPTLASLLCISFVPNLFRPDKHWRAPADTHHAALHVRQ